MKVSMRKIIEVIIIIIFLAVAAWVIAGWMIEDILR